MKILYTLSLLLTSISVFSQNGIKGEYFILKTNENKISINTFKNSKIKPHKTYSITKKSIYTTDKKSKVVLLDTSTNIVTIHNFKLSTWQTLSIPYDFEPKTILLNKYNLFVGGKNGNEILVQYNFNNNTWDQLDIPKEILMYGKAIDDLVINDSLLIAIDNIVVPKYILYYHLVPNSKLKLSHFRLLKHNSSYESIHQGRISKKYLGLVSETMNWGSAHEHITIYSDLDLINSFALSSEFEKERSFNDILIINDALIIAHKKKGLGKLKI